VIAVGGARPIPPGAPAAPPVGPHEPGDAFGAVSLAALFEFVPDARRPVALLVLGVDRLNVPQERGIGRLPGAGPARLPSVVAGAGHVERGAEVRDGVFGFHGFNPLVALFDGSVKMPTVFFNMSRCSRTRASSALRARFSLSRSARTGVASPE